MRREGFPQVVVAVHEQQMGLAASSCHARGIIHRGRRVGSPVHDEHRTANGGGGVNRRNRVEVRADDVLDVLQTYQPSAG